jgi:hypothetical protein
MAFLTDDDFHTFIKPEILSTITGGDLNLRARAVKTAEKEVLKFMDVRFDAAAELAKTGDARDPDLIRIMVDITLYHLHKRINPGQVPEVRREAYNNAIDDLKMIASGKLKPAWKEPDGQATGTKFDVKYGGRSPRNQYF